MNNGVQLVFNGITTNFCGIGNSTTAAGVNGFINPPNGTAQQIYSNGSAYITGPSSPPFDYEEYQPLSLPTKSEIRKAIKDLDKILGE